MIAIVLNPASGVAPRAHARQEVEALCRDAGLDARIHEPADPRELSVAAQQALQAHAEAVVAAGGDGTVSAVASVLAGTSTPLGVLPLGTLNHFAKDLGIPMDLEKAVRTVAARNSRHVDVACVNDRVFINNSSIGVYPSVVASRERLRQQGRSKWVALALATLDVLRRGGE